MELVTVAGSSVLVDAFAGMIGHRAVLKQRLPAVNIHSMAVVVGIRHTLEIAVEQTVPHQVRSGAVDAAAMHRARGLILVNDGVPYGHGTRIRDKSQASVAPACAVVHHGIPFHAAIGQYRAVFKAA